MTNQLSGRHAAITLPRLTSGQIGRNWTMTRLALRRCSICLLAALVALLSSSSSSVAADEEPADAYQANWEQLSELLRRREYGSAASLLNSLAEKPELRQYGRRIESDKAVVGGLQILAQLVRQQAAQLSAGARLEISGIEYTLVSFEPNPTGDALILKSKAAGSELSKLVSELPSATWLDLAGANLDSLSDRALVLAVFLGFDQSSDIKAARKLFSEAAAGGNDVAHWLERLDALEAEKSRTPGKPSSSKDDEPTVIATWAHQVNDNRRIVRRQTLKLYSNGRIDGPDGRGTWEAKGRILILTFPDPRAPGGQWKDVCNVSSDGKSYIGKNQRGFTLRGRKLDNGDEAKK